MNSLKNWWHKIEFAPGILGLIYNPSYLIRRALFDGIKPFIFSLEGKILDFGCGSKPYEFLFANKDYVGVDIEISGHDHRNSKIDFFYDGKSLPFENESFDNIFSSEVFEHVFNLEEMILEINRVLKPNGNLLISMPFVWEEHEVPYDCKRYTSFGIQDFLTKNGFEILELKKTGNGIQVVHQLMIQTILEILPDNGKLKRLVALFIAPPLTFFGLFWSFLLPKNKKLYFNNVVLARKIKS